MMAQQFSAFKVIKNYDVHGSGRYWHQVKTFSELVDLLAFKLRSEKFKLSQLHQFLETQRLRLPWEHCDAQIQETLIAFDDELQFKLQQVLHEGLHLAYYQHYPDCGGSRGVMLMIALMKCINSLEVSLGIDDCHPAGISK